MPRVLFLGDIVGRPGRTFAMDRVAGLRESLSADFVIANAENAAGGAGLTAAIAGQLREAGFDALTLGDHVWDQKGFDGEIPGLDYVCRPANLPENNPGRPALILEREGFRLGVFTVLGRNYLGMKSECPFKCADRLLTEVFAGCDAVFSEAHMEATSEKIAYGRYLDGRACAVVGTHTHVPTADTGILRGGTGYLTDAGMCGPYDSVLGRESGSVVATFLDGMKRKLPVAEEDVRLCGCVVDIQPTTGLAAAMERLEVRRDEETSAPR